MTTILVARHGETDWNRAQRWQGQADPVLNELGREQARELGERLAGERLEAIYTSDLRRAHETAEIVGERLGLPVTTDPDLREIDVGTWSGLTREQIGDRGWDGESQDAHSERILRAIRRIVEQHPEGRVAIVTHGGSLRRVYEAAEAVEQRAFQNCEVVSIRVEAETLHLLD